MTLYIAVFLTLYITSLIKNNKQYAYLLLLFLIFLCGLRSRFCGIDTNTYYSIFKHTINYRNLIEPGYLLLNDISANIYNHFNVFLVIISSLTLGITFYVCRKNTRNPLFSIFIYYSMYIYLNSFNIMRQCLAAAFILLAYHYYFNKKYIPAALIFGIACSVHLSALLSITFIVFDKIKLNMHRIILLLIATYIFGLIFNNTLFTLLAGKYTAYADTVFGFREYNISTLLLAILMNVFFVSSLYFSNRENIKNNWTKVLLLGILCMNMTQKLALGTRLMIYFTQAQIIYYPNFIRAKRKDKGIWYCLIIVYFTLNFLKTLYFSAESKMEQNIFPYQPFFNF